MSQNHETKGESSSNLHSSDSVENVTSQTETQQNDDEEKPDGRKETSEGSSAKKQTSAEGGQNKSFSEEQIAKKQSSDEEGQLEKVSGKSSSTSQSESSKKSTPSEKMRRAFIWTMTSFFDFNAYYLLQMRGLMNILHVIVSLTIVIILGTACQLRPYPESASEGFYCRASETFLFVVACCSFIISVIYLCCCLLSQTTDLLLFRSSFEITYYILFFILFLTAGLTLILSAINWGSDRSAYGSDFDSSQTGAIIGLVTAVLYGISATWFFVSHRYSRQNLPERNIE